MRLKISTDTETLAELDVDPTYVWKDLLMVASKGWGEQARLRHGKALEAILADRV